MLRPPHLRFSAMTFFADIHGRTSGRASTVFKFCKAVRFVALSGEATKPTESLFAEDPMQWISRLRDEGTSSLRLHDIPLNDPRISDRMSVGFVGGGGRWVIETRQAQASDLWQARWQVMNKDDPDQKIWGVTYFRTDQGRPHIPLQTKSLTALRQDLMTVLSGIEAFAARHKLEHFAGAFRKATALLSSDHPLAETYHSDLVPTAAMSLEAKQLLGAVQTAWYSAEWAPGTISDSTETISRKTTSFPASCSCCSTKHSVARSTQQAALRARRQNFPGYLAAYVRD